jgi:hypothetical protein
MRLRTILALGGLLAITACAKPNTTADDVGPPSPEVIKNLAAGVYKNAWGHDPKDLTIDPVQKVSVFWGSTDYVVCFRTTEAASGEIHRAKQDGTPLYRTHKRGDPYLRMSSVVRLRKTDQGWGAEAYQEVVDSSRKPYGLLSKTGKLGRIKTTDLCPKSTKI